MSARTDIIRASYKRDLVHHSEVTTITVQASSYTSGNTLHSGVLVFNDVFTSEVESRIELLSISLWETITSGSLAKKAIDVYIFTECEDAEALVINNAFTLFGTTSIYDLVNECPFVIVGADWKEVKDSSGNAYHAHVIHKPPTEVFIDKPATGTKYLKMVIVAKDTTAFEATTDLAKVRIDFKIH